MHFSYAADPLPKKPKRELNLNKVEVKPNIQINE